MFVSLVLFILPLFSIDWQNHTGNQVYQLSQFESPASLEELQALVKNAEKVKAIGEGYSLSDVGQTSGAMISLKRLNRILFQEGCRVKVETGITLKELNKELFERGLSLLNLPATDEFSLGGVISTGAHGSGHTGTVSSFVKSIDLIDAKGNLVTLNEDSEVFHAAIVGLGALGIIYAVELECVPCFYLEKTTEVSSFPAILDQIETLNKENDYFSFFLDVKTDEATLLKWNKSDKGIPSHESLCWYGIKSGDKKIFSEITVPTEKLKLALTLLREKLRSYEGFEMEKLHIRFVDQDTNSYLSPAFDGNKAYIAICILGEEKAMPLFQDLEESLLFIGGRPHWGKIHFLTREKTQQLYGPNYDKFKSIKDLLDPNRKFSNPFLDKIFN